MLRRQTTRTGRMNRNVRNKEGMASLDNSESSSEAERVKGSDESIKFEIYKQKE